LSDGLQAVGELWVGGTRQCQVEQRRVVGEAELGREVWFIGSFELDFSGTSRRRGVTEDEPVEVLPEILVGQVVGMDPGEAPRGRRTVDPRGSAVGFPLDSPDEAAEA